MPDIEVDRKYHKSKWDVVQSEIVQCATISATPILGLQSKNQFFELGYNIKKKVKAASV